MQEGVPTQSPREATAGAGRVRIKGTDPRVREVTNRIGRGYQPTADAFAESSAGQRYRQNMPKPYDPNQRYFHVHDVPEDVDIRQRAQAFREKGIIGSARTSFGEGPQVFAHPGGMPPKLGPRQIAVEFDSPNRPSGHGTSFMGRPGASTATSFSGSIPPERTHAVYGNTPSGISRIADAGSTTLGLMGLLGTAAQFIPGFADRMPRTSWLANGGPIGDVLNSVIASNYGQGGIMDPYRDYQGPRDPTTGAILA